VICAATTRTPRLERIPNLFQFFRVKPRFRGMDTDCDFAFGVGGIVNFHSDANPSTILRPYLGSVLQPIALREAPLGSPITAGLGWDVNIHKKSCLFKN